MFSFITYSWILMGIICTCDTWILTVDLHWQMKKLMSNYSVFHNILNTISAVRDLLFLVVRYLKFCNRVGLMSRTIWDSNLLEWCPDDLEARILRYLSQCPKSVFLLNHTHRTGFRNYENLKTVSRITV